MDKEKILQDIKWVDDFIEHLRRTRDSRDIRHSIHILEKRRQSLLDKLTQNNEIN